MQVDRLELRNALTHSSIPGEGRQPLPTCGPSLHVPASPLKHAHATHKFFDLAYYRRRQVATRPGPCQKPAGPRQRAATSTVGRPARATQVLAPKAGSSPAHQARPAPIAQEDTRDAVKASASRSLAAEQAADDGANAAGTPQAVQSAKNTEDRAWSGKRGGMFLPCCLCSSTCSGALMDEQEEGGDAVERDAVAVTATDPGSTSFGEAEAQPPSSPVPGNLEHEVSKTQVVGSRHEVSGGRIRRAHSAGKSGRLSPAMARRLPECVKDCCRGQLGHEGASRPAALRQFGIREQDCSSH